MAVIACPECAELTSRGCACDHCGAVLASCGTGIRSSAAVLLGLSLVGCPPIIAQPKYGVADSGLEDLDGDGFHVPVDCDDGDPDIHPDAEETPGDGVDSNCDGDDDT